MPRFPVVTSKDLVRVLKQLGFSLFHQVGSHAQFRRADGRRVTISIHAGQEIKRKTLRGIIGDLDMTIEEFTKILRS